MYKIQLVALLFLLMAACTPKEKSEPTEINVETSTDSLIIVAESIIYDVIIIPQSDNDEWEAEKLEGFSGSEMINSLFESIYNDKVEVFDYHSGEKMSISDVKKMENSEGFEREKIGKIQFTENWYYNPDNLKMEKEIVSIVPGYESRSSDGLIISYKAAFRLDMK